jgi:uncharacterized membrane protein
MLDILKHVVLVYFISIITDFIIVGAVTYYFTNSIGTSIAIATVSNVLMYFTGSLLTRFALN